MSARGGAEWTSVAGALAVAAAFVLLFRAAVVRDVGQPNFELFPDMARGPAAQSQSAGDPVTGGGTDRAIPPGVIVRGRPTFRYGPGPDEAARAGRELTNPFTADGPDGAAALDRGARIFARDCVVCHGADGQGSGAAVLRGMLPPPSLTAERAVSLPDGHLFHILTRGQGNMASYAVQVPPEDRWKVILHVRGLQAASRAKEPK